MNQLRKKVLMDFRLCPCCKSPLLDKVRRTTGAYNRCRKCASEFYDDDEIAVQPISLPYEVGTVFTKDDFLLDIYMPSLKYSEAEILDADADKVRLQFKGRDASDTYEEIFTIDELDEMTGRDISITQAEDVVVNSEEPIDDPQGVVDQLDTTDPEETVDKTDGFGIQGRYIMLRDHEKPAYAFQTKEGGNYTTKAMFVFRTADRRDRAFDRATRIRVENE